MTGSITDYIKTGISLVFAALANLPRLIVPLTPHMVTVVLFGAFIILNGGIVLGMYYLDRSPYLYRSSRIMQSR